MKSRQIRLLARHFLWRFLDNDLISPDSDVHAAAALLITFLAVPTLIGTGLLLFMYANPFVTPYERLVLALPDKFGYIAWSMLVVALVTVVDWDALSLDARDYAILGPLPIASSTLIAGKLAALALFAGTVIVAVNVVPIVFFPLVYLSSTAARIPLSLGVWMVLGHAASCVGAGVFAFLAMVALQSGMLLVLGPRMFNRVAAPMQCLVASALVIAFFNVSSTGLRTGGPALSLSPPMWFLGVYEVIAGRMIVGMPPDSALLTWQVRREHYAQQQYAAVQPLFPLLAQMALVALAVMVLVAAAFYFAGHFGHGSRLRQLSAAQPPTRTGLRRRLESLARRWIVRDPLAQASFFFTWQTLARSARHKLIAGAYIAAGALIVYSLISPLVAQPPRWLWRGPSVPLLALQFVLSFFVLVGLRAVFAIPAELRANWIFRLTTGGDVRRYMLGVRRMLAIFVVVPLFAAMLPPHAWLWGWRTALLHAGFGVLWAALLVEVLLLGLEKLPFTCSHVSASGDLKVFWPVSVFAFVLYVFAFAAVEARALRTAAGSAALAIVLLAALAALVLYRSRLQAQPAGFVFEELPDGTPVTLDI